MQFRQGQKEAIARGELTLTFRRWRRPQAKVGGRYRVGSHVIEVTSVEQVDGSAITVADARAAGSRLSAGRARRRPRHISARRAIPRRRSIGSSSVRWREQARSSRCARRRRCTAIGGHRRADRSAGARWTRARSTVPGHRPRWKRLPRRRVAAPPTSPLRSRARRRSSRPTCANSKRSA